MKTIFILMFFINCVLNVKCQPLNNLINNSGIACNSKYQNKDNPFTFLIDPASQMKSDKMSIGFFGEQNYLLKELSHYLLAFHYPNQLGKMAMAVDYFGGENYNETSLLFNYAVSLNKKSAIGLVFHSQIVKISKNSNEYHVGASLGANFDLSDKWSSSFYWNDNFYNSTQREISLLNKIDFWCNLKCEVTQSFYFFSIFSKQYNLKPNLSAGIMYHFKKKLFLKYGFSGGLNQMYAGVTFAFDLMKVEVINAIHPQLGITPSLSFATNTNP